METHSCGSDSSWLDLWSICVCHRFLILFSFFIKSPHPPNFLFYRLKSRTFWFSALPCCACLHTEAKQRSGGGSERMLCHWSPLFPFACLSDVLLGWVPHSDGGDKMTGGEVAHASECQFGCKAQFPQKLPHAMKQKGQSRSMVNKLTYLHKTCKVKTHSDTGNSAW